MKRFLFAVSSLVFLFTGCVATQQDMVFFEERLMAVELDNQELQKNNAELQKKLQRNLDAMGETRKLSERDLRTNVATMNVNMEGLQEEVRLLKGRVEEVEYVVNRKVSGYQESGKKNTERIDEVGLSLAKLDRRVVQLEQYLNVEGKSSRPAPAATAQGAKKTPSASDKALYDMGRQAYDNGELDKARQHFLKLIQNHPGSENVDNAQFWIGESYYREKWYERAILEYQTVLEKYPKGNKVPGAMLKQGLALLKIGEKSSARLILQELVKKYPKAPETKVAAKKLKEF